MFQIEPILWLQSFSWMPLTLLLTAVTLLGYGTVYPGPLLVLAFGHRFRPTLGVVAAVVLAALLGDALKETVAYPRPDEIDSRVARTTAARPLDGFEHGGGRGFWDAPQPRAVTAVRLRAAGNYGFPSGHVSVATAFLACFAWFFRSRRAALVAGLWVPLMALSRMYLGRHFLADVLGGAVVGLVSAALAVLLFRPYVEGLVRDEANAQRSLATALAPLVSVALVLATPWLPLLPARYVGALAGLTLSCILLRKAGFPAGGGPPRLRMVRVGLASLVLGGGAAVIEGLVAVGGFPGRWTHLIGSIAVVAATFAGSPRLAIRCGLDARE